MQQLNDNQSITEFTIGSAQLNNAFESFPGSVFCKDKNGKYLEVNAVQIYIFGCASADDILGKNDCDFTNMDSAQSWNKNDNDVIYSGKPKTIIEHLHNGPFEKQAMPFLSHKFPLKNKSNKIIGIFGMSFLLDNVKAKQNWLTESGFQAKSKYLEFLNAIELHNYQITGNYGNVQLSKREMQCLFWCAKDKTAKKIADILGLSPRTIESYLITLKNKLNCSSKYELINIALKNPIIRSFVD